MGAKALVSRWMYVESSGGPGSVNPTSGAVGLPQWLGNRKQGTTSSTSVDDQIAHVLREIEGIESVSGKLLKDARTPEEGARGASAFERAEGYDARTHRDNFTDKTVKGIDRVEKAIGEAGKASTGQDVIPGQGDPHKPGFDPSSVKFHDFHKALDTIRNARPLAPWQQSMNEIYDYRSVENINNFHIASASSADMMGGDSLGRRPKNADLIRNTSSYAS